MGAQAVRRGVPAGSRSRLAGMVESRSWARAQLAAAARAGRALRLTLQADNAFYSQRAALAARGLPPTSAALDPVRLGGEVHARLAEIGEVEVGVGHLRIGEHGTQVLDPLALVGQPLLDVQR